MSTIKTLTELLENGLNANEHGIKFEFGSNVQNFNILKTKPVDSNKPVRGVARVLTGKYAPIKDLGSYNTVVMLEMLAPQTKVEKITQILDNFITINVGNRDEIDSYQTVINFDVPTVGSASMGVVGLGVPIQVVVYYEFIKNGVYGADIKVVSVGDDGAETALNLINKHIVREKTPVGFQNLGTNEVLNLNSQNSMALSCNFYLKNDEFSRQIFTDILDCQNQNKIYKIKLKLEQFGIEILSKYTMTSGNIRAEGGNVVVAECVFSKIMEV